ncbi:hypothetical protein APHAL10511_003659 [Amanita phalloides]|nr:hypothetical protein APHAL10511_003659 [Amanita phalloides]
MAFRFRTFRLFLTSLIILLSGTSIGLALSVMRVFSHPHVGWIVISIQATSIIRAVFSIARKQLFTSCQSVASEAVGLFVLFPFQLILALVIVSGPFTPEAENLPYTPLTLQIFVLINSAIQLLYTTGIIVTATLTVSAFDRDVWVRDIDASPSPFPVPVVLAFYFPCCFSLPQYGHHETNDKSAVPCFPGCNCTTKTSTLDSAMEPEMRVPRGGLLSGWKSSGSLSRTLVRVPNAAERRSSITIAFEV